MTGIYLFLLFQWSLIIFWTSNPVVTIYSLVSIFLTSSLLLITQNLHFLAFSYLIVYVGAISILFVFIVMMTSFHSFYVVSLSNLVVPSIFLLLFLSQGLSKGSWSLSIESLGEILTSYHPLSSFNLFFLSYYLFSKFSQILITISFVIFLGIVGPIVILV